MKVSIILRAFNNEATIERATRSALTQNFPKEDFEIVAVNDGSTDGSLNLLKNYEHEENFRIINQRNRGLGAAANTGILKSKGDYILFLDADDELKKDSLKRCADILDLKPKVDFVYGNYIEEYLGREKTVFVKNIFESLIGAIMFRRNKLVDVGMFRQKLLFIDYDLLLRTTSTWRNLHVGTNIFVYHRSKNSLTGNNKRVRKGIEQLKKVHPDKLSLISQIRCYQL